MSFAEQINDGALACTAAKDAGTAEVMAGAQLVAATPTAIALGSAVVAAAWTGAQVGDIAD